MAKFDKWCLDLETALATPFPQAVVQQKRMGGATIDFVAWHHYARRLNELVGGGWESKDPVYRDVAGKLVMAVPLTILGVTRTNFGDEDEGHDAYGTACTNAWAQGFKRSCALFGLGLGMYDKAGLAARAEVPAAEVTDMPPAPKPRASTKTPPTFDSDNTPHCPVCNGMVWDNTVSGKKTPKSPDYKCRDSYSRKCEWAYWMPHESKSDEPPANLWGDA